eukprot:NODE_10507_length_1346_cov_7.348646.p1 GENE.NODE_10507_length_1346_cov_7.348646~~NODE_10507_length_1346_cov_7.348646.p1  ORF type:complete len:349 (+),score=85.44 NODE_10507_length_1346_cov_7.348646:88-1134(+)
MSLEGGPASQYVFFIRHGESRWNKAQSGANLVGMWGEHDHGLSERGRDEAESLRSRIAAATIINPSDRQDVSEQQQQEQQQQQQQHDSKWYKEFLKPDYLISSPFTRAMSTTAIALRDLEPASGKLTVWRSAREHRNNCATDTVGTAVGHAIKEHLFAELQELHSTAGLNDLGHEVAAKLELTSVDVSDVEDAWWAEGPEVLEAAEARLEVFMRQLRALGSRTSTIVVGHSIFFMQAFQTHINNSAMAASLDLVAALQMNYIPCCGVVGVRLEWDENGSGCIVDALPLFGTVLMPANLDRWRRGLLPKRGECCISCASPQPCRTDGCLGCYRRDDGGVRGALYQCTVC